MKTLVLGGTRSGKSRLAEQIAINSGLSVTYIATAQNRDEEMQQRIDAHRQRRPDHWTIVEEPICLADVLKAQAREDHCLLIDCLTLWLTNCLLEDDNQLYAHQKQSLLDCLSDLSGQIIFVSNETNMGVTPMGELSRRFCDETGLLHQQIAEVCHHVILTVAGLPHILKGDKL